MFKNPPKGEYEQKLTSLKHQRSLWAVAGVLAAVATGGIALLWEVPIILAIPAAASALYSGYKNLQKHHEIRALEKHIVKEADRMHTEKAASVSQDLPEHTMGDVPGDRWRNAVQTDRYQPAVGNGRS